MTPTRVRGTHAQARPTGRGGRGLAIVAAVAGGVTLLIRLALHTRSFDLYGDEVIYVVHAMELSSAMKKVYRRRRRSS